MTNAETCRGFVLGFRLLSARQQSNEEALAALVKARCTLDDFDPALKILAVDEASPASIDTWTLQQVRGTGF